MHRHRRHVLMTALGMVLVVGQVPSSHTAVTSRWNYNEHVFPIFREYCGACHHEGGAAPMSLLTYRAAYPWTQSIREEILGLRMPPWQAENGFGSFRNGHALEAAEMDKLLEWSSGGYPQGPRDQIPPEPVYSTEWKLGRPAVVLELPEAYTMGVGTSEAVRYFVLPSGTSEDQWITAVDFQPDARAVVRSAAVFIDATVPARRRDLGTGGPGFAPADAHDFPAVPPVAVWIPGQEPVVTEGMGFPLPNGADVVLRIHYKKTWIAEGQKFDDQSRVGLYFSNADPTSIRTMVITPSEAVSGRKVTFSHRVDQEVRLLALLPEVLVESSEMRVEAVGPDGSRVPLLWLREPDPAWPTRFWFDAPVALSPGTQLEVSTTLKAGAGRRAEAPLLGTDGSPIRLGVDYVTRSAAAN